MSDFLSKVGFGIGLSIMLFIPIVAFTVILGLPGICILGIMALIIIFTGGLSNTQTVDFMNSAFDIPPLEEMRTECSFCGEEHEDEDCYYMGIDALTGGEIL